MSSLNIAFGGRMNSGKDTAVNYLLQQFPGTKHSFAKPLYEIQKYAQHKCGFPIEKDRLFLQFIGTEWARTRDPDVWVRLALRDIPRGNVFISDLRFPNEFKALKEKNWFCVKITRRTLESREGHAAVNHISENVVDAIPDDEWDAIISNDSGIDSFYQKLDAMIMGFTDGSHIV